MDTGIKVLCMQLTSFQSQAPNLVPGAPSGTHTHTLLKALGLQRVLSPQLGASSERGGSHLEGGLSEKGAATERAPPT